MSQYETPRRGNLDVMAGPEDGAVPERLRLHQVANRQGPAVPQRLLASWQRSEEYGVSLEGVEPVFTGTDGLSGGKESLFYECGVEVLQDLQQTPTTTKWSTLRLWTSREQRARNRIGRVLRRGD